jgi:hypothetical protein
MKKTAFHEAGASMDPTIKQIAKGGKEGPGRGLYQYEVDRSADGIAGSNAGATAIVRALEVYKKAGVTPPKLLADAAKDGVVEFDKLSPKTQSALFLLDKLGGPGPTSEMLKGDKSLAKFLADYHFAGSDAKRIEYADKFLADSELFEQKYRPFKSLAEKPKK